jgi:histidine triad (HIT) family protein
MGDCLFCKFADGRIKKDFEYEDKEVMVFKDINPIKPVHLLIVPKRHINDFMDLEDLNLIKKLMETIKKMVKQTKLNKKGFRVAVNGGGAQAIEHLHFHLVGPVDKTADL